jgi:hypothetical protein
MEAERKEQEEKELEKAHTFLLKDYELKINYLTNQFSRMWTRFNFFLTVETALVGGGFLVGKGTLMPEIAALGAMLSLVWYLFGAEDRYLVLIYRNQIKAVTERNEFNAPQSHEYVGQVDGLKGLSPHEPDRSGAVVP